MKSNPLSPEAMAFHRRRGRVRISVSHNCQLKCQFCHQEGISNHWNNTYITEGYFRDLLSALNFLGVKEINLTGGDPLLHPSINALIEIAWAMDFSTFICTNGLLLNRAFDSISAGHLAQIKLSVHDVFSDQRSLDVLGKAWSFRKVEANVLGAIDRGISELQVNFTNTKDSFRSFRHVAERAIKWDAKLIVCDLIATRWNEQLQGAECKTEDIEGILLDYASPNGAVTDDVGCILKKYKSQTGRDWFIKDHGFGLYYSAMCDGCLQRPICGEGVFALRFDCDGHISPCLLRADLARKVDPQTSSIEYIQRQIADVMGLMTE